MEWATFGFRQGADCGSEGSGKAPTIGSWRREAAPLTTGDAPLSGSARAHSAHSHQKMIADDINNDTILTWLGLKT